MIVGVRGRGVNDCVLVAMPVPTSETSRDVVGIDGDCCGSGSGYGSGVDGRVNRNQWVNRSPHGLTHRPIPGGISPAVAVAVAVGGMVRVVIVIVERGYGGGDGCCCSSGC